VASFNAVERQMTEMFQCPKCEQKWSKCFSKKISVNA